MQNPCAGEQPHHPVMQIEFSQHILGAGQHALVLALLFSGVVIETSSTLMT